MDALLAHRSFRDIKKILLIKLKHIGDVLLAAPCIRALHEVFPSARISALVNEGTEPVLMNHPLLEEIIRFPRSSMKGSFLGRVRKEAEFAREIRRRGFDLVLDLTTGDRAAWLGWLSGARYRLAHDPQGKGFWGKRFLYTHVAPYPRLPDLHEVRKNLAILEHFGFPCSSPRMEMHPSEYDQRRVNDLLASKEMNAGFSETSPQLSGFVLVHPTSRWLFKCWEDSRFAALVDWIQDARGLPVVLTCGPDIREQERARRVLSFCSTRPRILLGTLSLPEWAALVRQARAFIGVDSAPMHIAASQGIPTLAFFGPTGFQNWRPWGVRHVVLVHDCPCSRDRQPHCDWNRVRACMKAISFEEAKDAFSQLLASPS